MPTWVIEIGTTGTVGKYGTYTVEADDRQSAINKAMDLSNEEYYRNRLKGE